MYKLKKKIANTIYSVLPIKLMYKTEFYRVHKKNINLGFPQTFNEKLYWLNRYNEIYNLELIRKIYDKNSVREYVKNLGLEEILPSQICTFDNAEDIDFKLLPEKYVLKISQGSHKTVICNNKEQIDEDYVKSKLAEWLDDARRYSNPFDGYYFDGKACIVCENLMETENGKIPNDIKFFCFNGRVQFVYVDIDSIDENNVKKEQYYRNCYDREWNKLPIDFCLKSNNQIIIEKPLHFDKMIEYAEKLSKDFIFVRVDMYNIDGDIKFGELTPIPGMGFKLNPPDLDAELGALLQLPNIKVF